MMRVAYKFWVGSSILTAIALLGVLVAVAAQVGAAPDKPRGDQAAMQTCKAIVPIASDYGAITGLLRAETSTAGAVAYWQETVARAVEWCLRSAA